MDRFLFATALFLGAIAIVGMGMIFLETDTLAFVITFVIACVYLVGVTELHAFRRATATIGAALDDVEGIGDHLAVWLERLDPSVRNAVRLRIENERGALSAPVLTPYLVGLLVMLGLLGTFVGMVDTLKGAVTALEGTTELQAIREGLQAPMDGLRLAFGTSVAGVAASAMLGLMSTLSRRHRIRTVRRLDTMLPTVFRRFSRVHRQQETMRALRVQTEAMPQVASRLTTMADRLTDLSEKLVQNQESFHMAAEQTYLRLAESMAKSLAGHREESLERLRDTLQPAIGAAMAGIAQETRRVHAHLINASEESLSDVSHCLAEHAQSIDASWAESLAEHNRTNDRLRQHMEEGLDRFREQWDDMARAVAEAFSQETAAWIKGQEEVEKKRLDGWSATLNRSQRETANSLGGLVKTHLADLHRAVAAQQDGLASATERLLGASANAAETWQQSESATQKRHMDLLDSLKRSVEALEGASRKAGGQIQAETDRIMDASAALIESRAETERQWCQEHRARMDAITGALAQGLDRLRDTESQRGEAAVARIADLEATVAAHLKRLGEGLTSPMVRLVEKASEAPRAALALISQLSEASAQRLAQDEGQLAAHQRLAGEFEKLSTTMVQASDDTHRNIANLVARSEKILESVGERFACQVHGQVSGFSDVAETFAAGAVELASLGDAFNAAVERFDASNGTLVENLSRIEASLDKTATRSDDQLGYYVAQAREIIDHCMLSQQELLTAIGRSEEGEPEATARAEDRKWKS